MSKLILTDLPRHEELDGHAMTTVRGGSYCGWKAPSCTPVCAPVCPPGYGMPAPSNTTTTVSIDQSNKQCQSNATGNGSAVFGGGIEAYNNQQGFNNIGGYGFA